MSTAAFGDLRRTIQALPAARIMLLRGRVLETPATVEKLVPVEAINDASAGELYLGMASWPKPAGKEKPVAGDECLVALDDENGPWIVAWAIPNWGH